VISIRFPKEFRNQKLNFPISAHLAAALKSAQLKRTNKIRTISEEFSKTLKKKQ